MDTLQKVVYQSMSQNRSPGPGIGKQRGQRCAQEWRLIFTDAGGIFLVEPNSRVCSGVEVVDMQAELIKESLDSHANGGVISRLGNIRGQVEGLDIRSRIGDAIIFCADSRIRDFAQTLFGTPRRLRKA